MVLYFVIDGRSEIDARVRSNLRYLISLKHSIRSRAVAGFESNLEFDRHPDHG